MKNFIIKYKKNILQFIGLSIGYLITNCIIFIALLVVFTVLILFFPNIYFKISSGIDAIINFIGNSIKSILFFLLYIFILVPTSLLQKIFKKNEKKSATYFIEVNKKITSEDLIKMW
jgi:uncharacterized protein YqhQ